MKKIIVICLAAILTTSAISAIPVNEKVLEVFATSFPEVQQTTWYNYNDYYAVYFKNADSSKCRIEYDINGNTEVSSGDELAYHIVLEDETNCYNVKSDAIGYINLEKKMEKAGK